MIAIMFICFVLFLVLGMPIVFVLGVSGFIYIYLSGDIPMTIIPLRMVTGIDNFVLLAIPFFMLAGSLMNRGGITEKLISFGKLFFGRVHGGLAYVNILASMFFAGISGSATAEAAAIGSVMIPSMTKDGYEPEFACALTATASTMGPIIPPSMPFVIYGAMAGVSVGKLLIAGIIPGVLIGLTQAILVFYYARTTGKFPAYELKIPWKEKIRRSGDAILALILLVIIVGGIFGGIFSPTEAACVGVIYAFVIGGLVYRNLKWKDVWEILLETGILSGSILLILCTANILTWVITFEKIPALMAQALHSLTTSKFVFLVLMNVVLLFVGCLLEGLPALFILVPVLVPLALSYGVDPIHLGVIMVLNIVIGLTVPPTGICLWIVCSISKLPLEVVSRRIIPFVVLNIGVLGLVTYIPWLSLVIPHLM